MFNFDSEKAKKIIQLALAEDIGSGDITTQYTVGIDEIAQAVISAKEECILAGIPVAQMIFNEIDPSLEVTILVSEGEVCFPGEILSVSGRAASILVAERTVLNFMQRLSGIATCTNEYVRKVEQYGTAILDTRKTTPGLRYLEKYAVRVGGGTNHREGLYDAILIKENHMKIAERKGNDYLKTAIDEIRSKSNVQIIVEVHDMNHLDDVLATVPDVVLFDNLDSQTLREGIRRTQKKVLTEASGNISLDTVEEYAATGVDRISVGKLTHSVKSIDMSLEIL